MKIHVNSLCVPMQDFVKSINPLGISEIGGTEVEPLVLFLFFFLFFNIL